jgi:uncharacterized membrane protein
MVVVGIAILVKGDFVAVWEPPDAVPARELLAYLCAFISIACGLGLLWPRSAALAARVLLASLLVLGLLLFKAPAFARAPAQAVSWESCAETLGILAGAWVLYAWLAGPWDRRRLGFATAERGVRIARAFYGLSMIVFGVAHFAYLDYTASLVPRWLPWHVAWASFTGAAYIVAGVAILIGLYARVAAALSAVQMGIFTALVWLPAVAARPTDASVWSETIVSWTLTAAGWVVADSYRRTPRLSSQR